MATMSEKLLERAAYYEQKAAALRLAAHEMNGHLTDRKQEGAAAMLTAAMQLRERQQQATEGPQKPKAPVTQAQIKARRRRSAAVLAKLNTTEPRPLSLHDRRAAGGLAVHGYIRKKGDGYIRTAKEFDV